MSKTHGQSMIIHGQSNNIEQNPSNSQKKHQNICSTDIIPPSNDVGKMIETKYCCDYCQFSTTIKKEAEKHRKSKQHTINENKIEDFLEITTLYICMSCDKSYNKYKSCWEHSKRCRKKCLQKKATHSEENNVFVGFTAPLVTYKPRSSVDVTDLRSVKSTDDEIVEKSTLEEPNTSNFGKRCEAPRTVATKGGHPIQLTTPVAELPESFGKTVGVFETIIEKNTTMMESLMEKMITVMEKMTETMANSKNNTNYTNNNSNNNNHYTINMFLNEKCKDAINITDWAKQLHINYDHLYYTGENGFQKGLTNMLVENLKLCDIYNRPIHFTDIKRDSMYIREDDEWTKHENSEKLTEVLEISARQACIRLTDWMKEHENVPDYHDLDSELGQQYLALMVSVIRPQVERTKAFPKVIKELAKTAQLRKEDQV